MLPQLLSAEGVAEASKKLCHRPPPPAAPLGFLPWVLIPAAPPDQLATLRSPSGRQLPGAPSSQHTLSCILLSPMAWQGGLFVSRSSAPLGISSLLWLLSLPDPGSLVTLASDSQGKVPVLLRMNIYLILPKGIQNQPAVTTHTHPTSTCSFPGDWQHEVGAQKEKCQWEPLPSSGSTTPESPAAVS